MAGAIAIAVEKDLIREVDIDKSLFDLYRDILAESADGCLQIHYQDKIYRIAVCYGGLQILKKHWRSLLPRAGSLTRT